MDWVIVRVILNSIRNPISNLSLDFIPNLTQNPTLHYWYPKPFEKMLNITSYAISHKLADKEWEKIAQRTGKAVNKKFVIAILVPLR